MSLLTPQKIQELSASLHLEDLAEEEQAELLSDIGELLFEGAMTRVFDILNEEDSEKLADLFDASTADPENEEKSNAITAFIEKHVPSFDTYLAEEAELLAETWVQQAESK